MDKSTLTNKNTLYAFEKVDLNYDRNDKVKISTLSTRVTKVNINGENKKLVIFCRKDVAVQNLKSEKHRLQNLKNEQNKTVKYLTRYLKSTGMNENQINKLIEQIKMPHVMIGKYTEAELKIQKDAIEAQNGDLVDGKELSDKEVTDLCQQASDIKTRKFNSSKSVEFISANYFESVIPQPTNIEVFMSKNNSDLTNQENHTVSSFNIQNNKTSFADMTDTTSSSSAGGDIDSPITKNSNDDRIEKKPSSTLQEVKSNSKIKPRPKPLPKSPLSIKNNINVSTKESSDTTKKFSSNT